MPETLNNPKERKFSWYMVSTLPNKEEQVIKDLKNKVKSENLEAQFAEFKIFYEPKITKNELAKRQRGEEYKQTKVNIYKGYIFIRMIITDESWFLTRNTEGVTGLIGSHGSGVKPTPISDRKFKIYLEAEKEKERNFEASLKTALFNPGDLVKVLAGEFTSQTEHEVYKVAAINEKKATADLVVEYAGKKVTVEIDFANLELVKKD